MVIDTDPTPERIARLKTKPWNSKGFSVPEVFAVPGMLSNQEKRMLYYLARDEYTGEGIIADMGSFLGGSTICFAAGLRGSSFTRPVIHAYDLFKLGEGSMEHRKYFPENPPPDFRTRAIFDQNLKDYLELITVHEGDVLSFPWDGEPIEILFIDIAKSYKVMDHLLMNYFPALIPSKSLIVMQDYFWGTSGPWHHVVMEKLSDYCEYVVDTEINSAVFLVKQRIPTEILGQCQWMEIPQDEKLLLMESAIERLDTDDKKRFLMESQEILLQGKDKYWGMQYHKLLGNVGADFQ